MKQIEFVPLRPGERPNLFALFEECFGHQADEAWWKWKYESTPYERGLNLLALVEDNLAGHYGAYGVKCQKANGEVFWANQIGDVMISPRYRGVGVGKKALITRLTHAFYETLCNGVAFNYGCPSERHARLGRALLKYEVLDPITVWELDLSKWKMPFADRLRATFLKKISKISIGEVPISIECEQLYKNVVHQYPMSIAKEMAYLKWRYGERPQTTYLTQGIRLGSRLHLWSVFKVVGNTIELGELLFHFGDRYLFSILIDHLARCFPAHRLTLWCNPHIGDIVHLLQSLGFSSNSHPERIFLTATIFDSTAFPREFIRKGFFYQMGDFDLF